MLLPAATLPCAAAMAWVGGEGAEIERRSPYKFAPQATITKFQFMGEHACCTGHKGCSKYGNILKENSFGAAVTNSEGA